MRSMHLNCILCVLSQPICDKCVNSSRRVDLFTMDDMPGLNSCAATLDRMYQLLISGV